MNGKWIFLTALLFYAAFCLSGCKTPDLTGLSATMRGAPIAEKLADMPEDAKKAVTATAGIMNGKPPLNQVLIPPAVARKLLAGTVQERGFSLVEARLYSYDFKGGEADCRIQAVAEFENSTGRRWQSRLDLRYRKSGDLISILDGSATPYFKAIPRTVCFVMPAEKLPGRQGALPTTFEELYLLAAQEAVTPGQAAAIKQERPWGMMVFYLDRVSPSAMVQVGVSASDQGMDIYCEESKYVDYNGWRVGFIAGSCVLTGKDAADPLYLKAVFTPGKEALLLKRTHLVGLFPLSR